MENLSEDVRRRRWKFIGHIMRKEPNNDCINLDTGRATKTGQTKDTHGGGQRRGKGKRLDGRIGVRYKSQRLTELVGGVVLRPYVPHGTKWMGEGEGNATSFLQQ